MLTWTSGSKLGWSARRRTISKLLDEAAQWMAYRPSSSLRFESLGSFCEGGHQSASIHRIANETGYLVPLEDALRW